MEATKENVRKRAEENMERGKIFISHRHEDRDVADMLTDFFVNTGIPNSMIFCSSLPGNDVRENIGMEVKENLDESRVIILLLSKDYYDSAYCLNEAGIAWYLDDVITIAIGFDDIDPVHMKGFLDDSFILRRLNNINDISSIYDIVQEALGINSVKHSIITREIQKLENRYLKFINDRDINIAIKEAKPREQTSEKKAFCSITSEKDNDIGLQQFSVFINNDYRGFNDNFYPFKNYPKINGNMIRFVLRAIYMDDAQNGLEFVNTECETLYSLTSEQIRRIRYLLTNALSLQFQIVNIGQMHATDVSIQFHIPKEFELLSNHDIRYIKWFDSESMNMDCAIDILALDKYDEPRLSDILSYDRFREYIRNLGDISDDEDSESKDSELVISDKDVFIGKNICFEKIEIGERKIYDDLLLIPTCIGEFELKITIKCNETKNLYEKKFKIIIE